MNPRNFLIPASLRAIGLHILRPLVVAVAGLKPRTANAKSQGGMRLFSKPQKRHFCGIDPVLPEKARCNALQGFCNGSVSVDQTPCFSPVHGKGPVPASFFTANSEPAASEMRLSAIISTANIAEAKDGEWVPIAPYGDHPSPDGTYTQKFDRAQAEKIVRTWNSITGKAARAFKNRWHGLEGMNCPVWDGHPETDQRRWPKAKLLAEITDIRAGSSEMEGCLHWTGNARPKGPLFPSPLWWHWPPQGEPPTVYPELLESIGLVPTPNIKSAAAWTANISDFGLGIDPQPANQTTQTENIMDKKKLTNLLGLAADATDEQIDTALKGFATTANALQTANTAKADIETQLKTANEKLKDATSNVATLTTERDKLKTANDGLTNEKAALITANGVLVNGVLDIAEKRGAITPAQRPDFETRLTTENTAAAALTELQTRKAMNTQPVEINGNRVDLSTANARAEALDTAIAQKMKEGNLSHSEAFARCKADPKLAGLFAAMADPTRKAS